MNTVRINNIIRLSAILLAALGTNTSCDSNELEQTIATQVQATEGVPMKFAIGEKQSRTAYYHDGSAYDDIFRDGLGIQWTNNDDVLVFCNQAYGDNKSAVYDITNIQSKGINAGMIARGKGLAYDDNDATLHTIHAVYPGDNQKVLSYTDGKILKLKINQPMLPTSSNVTKQGNRYIVPFDMSDLYMVATKDNLTKSQEVKLNFKPIMSVMRVVVENQSPYRENSYSENRMAGVSVRYQNKGKYVKDGCIQYDCSTGQLIPFEDADPKEVIDFNLNHGDSYTGFFLALHMYEEMEFTLILPPFPDISADNPLIIGLNREIMCDDQLYEITDLKPGTKKYVKIKPGPILG